jgi:hypothetical protein
MGARSARARTYDQDSLVTNNITDCNVTKQNVHFELILEFISGRDIRISRERAKKKMAYNVKKLLKKCHGRVYKERVYSCMTDYFHTSKNLEEEAIPHPSYTVWYLKISLYMRKSNSIFSFSALLEDKLLESQVQQVVIWQYHEMQLEDSDIFGYRKTVTLRKKSRAE